LTVMLVAILAFMGQRTVGKGLKMWREESEARIVSTTSIEMSADPLSGHAPLAAPETAGEDRPYVQMQADGAPSGTSRGPALEMSAAVAPASVHFKVGMLALCFVGTCLLTLLKGGGDFPSPLGVSCGSTGFWALYLGQVPWVLAFAFYFRSMLVTEFGEKVRTGYTFIKGEVEWNSHNTIKYPIICSISGLLAGLFGVGGGIVKGPLMLEMGVVPAVASASAAAMILFTAAAASISFIVFGLLHTAYGAMFFCLGITCTAVGQYTVGKWVKKYDRQSPIVLSIGSVIVLSSLLIAVDTVAEASGRSVSELLAPHAICSADA